jgi:hypothetical protein
MTPTGGAEPLAADQREAVPGVGANPVWPRHPRMPDHASTDVAVDVLRGPPRRGKTFAQRFPSAAGVLDPYVRYYVADGKGSTDWRPMRATYLCPSPSIQRIYDCSTVAPVVRRSPACR